MIESLELSNAELAVRVAVAVVLGGAVGIEREISGQPAGFRTHVALALGAALFGLISVHAFEPFTAPRGDTNVNVDVSRVAAQVATGVGFIGAGAILKHGASIRGLTTAASLWTTAAIGLAVGVGFFGAGIAVTVALLVALVGLRSVRRVIRRRLARDEGEATFRLVVGANPGNLVGDLHSLGEVTIHDLQISQDPEIGAPVVVVRLNATAGAPLEMVLVPLSERPDVDEMWVTPA